ncbi:MAG: hypothetical protein JWO31_2845 [Phycisphaerales bacterium]|nr:hypothetical protein [Phycisphaerales bacterium]
MAKGSTAVGLALTALTAAGGCAKPASTAAERPTTEPSGGGAVAAAVAPASAPSDAAQVAPGAEAGLDPLFTLPPSKGPAAHQFRQVTLLRSGPSGDLEMQLTGDGIYRIRDHGRGRSYAGDGQLDPAQLAGWADTFKDWDSLKDNYVPSPAPESADTVQILYGGKKVVAAVGAKETPKAFAEAYDKLLALNERAKREAAAEPSTQPAAAPVDGTAGAAPTK